MKFKRYRAKVKYIDHTFNMFVGGTNEESVKKRLIEFYKELLDDDKNIVEIELEEIK